MIKHGPMQTGRISVSIIFSCCLVFSAAASFCNDFFRPLNTIPFTGSDSSYLHTLAKLYYDDSYLAWATQPNTEASYNNSIYIPTSAHTCKGIGFHWTIDSTRGTIQIAAAFQTNSQQGYGWGAIGFSETGGMRGADVVYFSAATSSLTDAHILDYLGYPITDDHQDWTLINHSVTDDGYLIFEAIRDLDTHDDFDRAFMDDSSDFFSDHRLIASWGSSQYMQYHGENRARSSVQLFASNSSDSSIGAGLDYNNFIEEMSSRSEASSTLAVANLNIPLMNTYYHNECFELSELIDLDFLSDSSSPTYVIGYEFIIQPATRKYIHHIVVFGDSKSTCTTNDAPLFIFTPGEKYMYYPVGTGMKFGGTDGFQSMNVQIHFDNSDLDFAKVDTGSGIRLYYTKTPVKEEIGMMQIGDPNVAMEGHNVGAGLTRHTISCPSSFTESFQDEEITIMKQLLHMHSHGKRIVNEVIRDDSVIHTSYIDYWDFDQTGSPAPGHQPFQVRKGDSFHTTCNYDADSTTAFGLSTAEEMCMVFILYFPKQPVSTCGLDHPDLKQRANYLGRKYLQSEKELLRVFGNQKLSEPPTTLPTIVPSVLTEFPSFSPSTLSSYSPSNIPTEMPTTTPSLSQIMEPSEESFPPSDFPTEIPTSTPSLSQPSVESFNQKSSATARVGGKTSVVAVSVGIMFVVFLAGLVGVEGVSGL